MALGGKPGFARAAFRSSLLLPARARKVHGTLPPTVPHTYARAKSSPNSQALKRNHRQTHSLAWKLRNKSNPTRYLIQHPATRSKHPKKVKRSIGI